MAGDATTPGSSYLPFCLSPLRRALSCPEASRLAPLERRAEEIAGTLAEVNGDPILKGIHLSLDEDARWHRQWTASLMQVAFADTASNAEVVSEWIERWRPLAIDAVEARWRALPRRRPFPSTPQQSRGALRQRALTRLRNSSPPSS